VNRGHYFGTGKFASEEPGLSDAEQAGADCVPKAAVNNQRTRSRRQQVKETPNDMVLTKVDERQDLYELGNCCERAAASLKSPQTQQELVKASKGQDVTDYIDSRRTFKCFSLSRMELGLSCWRIAVSPKSIVYG